MKRRIVFTLVAVSLSILIFDSCEKENYENEYKVSRHNSTESHNMGLNCMGCHKQGGPGEGWFTIASTVYNSLQTSVYPNCSVKLYTGTNGTGTLKYEVEVDGNGNFYSTENIDFGPGLYPAVTSPNGTKYMSSLITSGNCTDCHGVNTGKIWAN